MRSHRFHIVFCVVMTLTVAMPAAAQSDRERRLGALAAELGAMTAKMREQLILFDQVNRMAVAQGAISVADSDTRLRAKAAELFASDPSTTDLAGLRNLHAQALEYWRGRVAARVAQGAQWPPGPPEIWQSMAQQLMNRVTTEYPQWLAGGLDTKALLQDIARVQGWTSGRVTLDAASNPFAGQDQRLINALASPRAREMMAGALGLAPRAGAPPPQQQAGGGTQRPVPGEMGGVAPRTPTGPTVARVDPAPPVQPRSSPVQVPAGLEDNVDRPGRDYKNFDLPSGAGPDMCRQACAGEPQMCRAFTYVRAGVQGPQPRCWLKSDVPPARANNCCVSGMGMVPDGLEHNVDRPGRDYKNFNLAAGTGPEGCRQACVAESSVCRAFTYVRAGVQGPLPRCWLKTEVPGAVANNCCVSGRGASPDPNALEKSLFGTPR